MRTRAIFSVVLLGFGATACSQILGIDERTLRDDNADSSDANLGNGDGGPGAKGDGGVAIDTNHPDGGGSDGSVHVDDGGSTLRDGGDAGATMDPALAQFPQKSVDFDLVGCGTGAPLKRTFSITNAGDGELDFAASLSSTATFALGGQGSGPTAGPLLGGESTDILVSSVGVPSFRAAGAVDSATLTVTITIDGVTTTQDFPVTQTAAGAQIEIDPTSVAFGQVQTGSSSAANPITFSNTGNLPIAIGLGAPGDPQFTLADAGGFSLAAGQSSSGLTATFAPTAAGSASTRVAVSASGNPVCGVVPTGIDLSGTGTVGPIAVQPGSLDFGMVDCAKQAAAQQINVTTTGAQLSWTASLGKGSSSPYVISPTAGSASSATPGVITVTPRGIPQTADVTADAFADTLTITAPDGTHSIPLHETAHGAILTQSTSSIAFGGVNTGSNATSQFNVVNTGNASATVSFDVKDAAFAISPQGAAVAGQGTPATTTASFTPTSASAYSTTAQMTTTSTVLCAPLPGQITLTGTGTTSIASVSPTTLDFGLVNCGGTGTKKQIKISNSSALFVGASFSWTATLGKGSSSPYKLSATSGSLGGQGSVTIDVTPNAIPAISSTTADAFADTLTITTNAANDSPHVISLHETAQGAVLALSPTTVSFGTVVGPATATQSFQIVNSGNYPASSVSLALGSSSVFSLGTSTNITVNGGSSVSDTATFKPSKASTGAKSTTVTPSFTGANCGGAPAAITLSGTAG